MSTPRQGTGASQTDARAVAPTAGADGSVHLHDLFDEKDLQHALNERLVVARKHPSAPLTILNYTERCQYEKGLWSPVTLACRGLIHDANGEVIARPFSKFFNYGDSNAPTMPLDAPVFVTDKLDGSLGILYRVGSGHAIATRGAFESEQAKHATALWREQYAGLAVPDGWTFLFEIIYPSNRIVCDYGERDELVLLGAVEIASGLSCAPNAASYMLGWHGPVAQTFGYETLADAIAATPRQNAEGVVIHFIDTDERVKVKQEDYVALHRIVTGLNERTVWDHCSAGKPIEELLEPLPDEFHEWVREVAARLHATVEGNAAEVERAYFTILANLSPDFTRKDFALVAKDSPYRASLFARHDGKDYRRALWDACYPEPRIGPRVVDEAAL